MRALVLAGGESWRLPGPVPKPFRLLGTRAVVAHVVWGLEQADWIDQIDVLVRFEHEHWATKALWNYECDLLPRPTMGPAARVIAEKGSSPLVVVLGDTLVTDHATQLKRLVANEGLRARVLVDDQTYAHYTDEGPTADGLRRVTTEGLIDVGSYYLPADYYLPSGLRDESLLAALIKAGPLDPVPLTRGARWRDVGSPEGFAAAELELVQRP